MAMSSIVWLLETAISTRSSGVGRATHARMIKSMDLPFPTFLCNHLVNMYSKLDLLDSAQLIIPPQHRSVVAWTALIAGTVQNGHFSTAILQFSNMHHHSILPNDFTFPCVFKACNSLSSPLTGRQLHALAIKLAQIHDVFVGCSAFDMYSKTGLKEDACKLFDEMPHKNLATWNTYMSNAVLDGKPRKAVEAFIKLKTSGGDLSSITFCVLLNGCSDALYLHLGKQVHGFVIRYGYEQHVSVANGMIDFYGKCRDVSSARMVFDAICNHNDVSWCSMVAAYEQNDEGEKACMLFSQAMRNKVEPKDFIVSSVISACAGIAACSRAGAVDAGLSIFESMRSRYGIEARVEHYACVVDMLGRAGMVEGAYEFIKRMPFHPTVSIWGSLLGACKVHRNNKLGKIAADHLFQLDPHDSGNHVILSNMFAAAGWWEEANVVRMEMKEVGISKGAGCSWISVKNSVHTFQAKDTCHERNTEIQTMLRKLKMEMKSAGYVADTSLALFDLEEEERESEVWHHSEKIALAFGLCVIPPGLPIRITKNMRICFDCHAAFKFISGITNREIIVRDNNRFHRFTKYDCSCRDYW
ncbi:putative tetratricopeptide-like helical domain superfamily, DYW domain-containing protein [Helianthus annuus]|nr:putative tetratricopeptide-like helical domain superfamily, DYW domain-containing protein [Helianthus annuus]KAJ0531530.1 putative tetratricopeptide-like helical domain superfamily, DYW domain-containing protein [Helianthus annuus]KAJ0698372.1 putative tetratricopeptide-like helical domain superfamily, DYW domain-containing protein [Helianthus annuus]